MVRRAEWALRKAQQKAQAEGAMRSRESNLTNNPRSAANGTSTPRDHFASSSEYRDALVMGELEAHEFEEVLTEAREEGNLSRANVADLAKARAGRKGKARPRPAAEKSLNTIESLADRAAREAQKLTADQIRRVKPNAAEWIGGIRNSIEVLQDLVRSLEEN